jgi:predicted O-methyltransferase YrrM
MKPRDTTRAIWKKFHVHPGDNLPFEGWWNSTRETLYELWGELGFTVGAEIGVRMGTNASAIFARVPNLKLYCIDPWGAYLRVTDHSQEVYYQRCVRKLKDKDAVLIKKMSMDAVKDFEDNSLDFIYIDGRHDYPFVLEDIIAWTPKVKVGGIVSGHDYYNFFQGGVVRAVDAYTMANNIKQWYITREKEHTWWFVKEG